MAHSVYGNADGLLHGDFVDRRLANDGETQEIKEALDLLREKCEKYVAYLKEYKKEEATFLPLSRNQATKTINCLNRDLMALGQMEDALADALLFRLEVESKPKEYTLAVADVGEVHA